MQNPWLDFASYQYSDRDRFKGREEDIAKFNLIMANGTMSVLYADSGIGKTSFINAGIEPVLVKKGYFPIHILFNEDLFNSDIEVDKWLISDIESKFYEIVKDSDSEKEDKRQIEEWCYLYSDEYPEIDSLKNNLWWRLHAYKIRDLRNGEILKPLIVFDQFEEVFIKGKEIFLESLFSIIEQVSSSTLPDAVCCVLDEQDEFEDLEIDRQHDFKILFSLRKDFLSDFDYWCNDRYSITELFQNRMLLKALSREQARQVICNQDGVDTLDEVADDIMEKIDDKHHNVVEPFILSVFCSRLYEKAISLNKEILKKEDLAQVDIKNIIRSFYEEKILSLIPNEGHRLAFETTLVDEDGFRKRERIASRKLAEIGFEKTYAKPLEDAHLIRIITINDAKCVEIVHDRISEVISERNKQREREKQVANEKAIVERKQKIAKFVTVVASVITIILAVLLVIIWDKKVELKRKNSELEVTQDSLSDSNSRLKELNARLVEQYDSLSRAKLTIQKQDSTLVENGRIIKQQKDNIETLKNMLSDNNLKSAERIKVGITTSTDSSGIEFK